MMRKAVAYDRLAAKAYRAGNTREWARYMKVSSQLKARSARAREAGR